MTEKILQRGAEAIIILHGKDIVKRRVKKGYRLPEIDEKIRKIRTRSESKLLEKASKIISIPKVVRIDEQKKEITMDFVNGKRLSDNLNNFPLSEQKKICKQIGTEIAKLHDSDIIHGDLTTSNMIYVGGKKLAKKQTTNDKSAVNVNSSSGLVGGNGLSDADNPFKIFLIDFGLGSISHKAEDKAVDLHLLKQALEAKHFTHWQSLFAEVLKGYATSKNAKKILEQFKKVEARGRYKESY